MITDTPGTDTSDPAAVSSAVPFTNTREPSAKEREVLAAVKEGLRRDGKAPTVRALAEMTGAASTSTVQRRISSLIDLGCYVEPMAPSRWSKKPSSPAIRTDRKPFKSNSSIRVTKNTMKPSSRCHLSF
ncbi:SOS-response repressor and protease LexA [Cutibacterium acnes JCM 18918]|nr:SOS-response repressor and protease LexA [Cutibacterium acnes JCM 18918]